MEEFKELNKLNEIVEDCERAIGRDGGLAEVVLAVPGKRDKNTHKRLFPKGPKGKIIAQTFDGRKLIVVFVAAEVKTKLEEIRNGIITSRN